MSGDRWREPAAVAGAWASVAALHLAVRGWRTAAVVSFLLALVLVLARGLPGALGRPRVGRAAAALLLALAAALVLQPASEPRYVPGGVVGVAFADSRARAYQEVATPPPPSDRAAVWAYVGVLGESAAVASARPVLTVAGRPLALEVASERAGYLRAHVPPSLLGAATVDLAFGFEAPSPDVALAACVFYDSGTGRVGSRWSADGAPPPSGPPLARRSRGLLGRLAGQSPFEPPRDPPAPGVPAGRRFVIELWVLDERGEVLATWS